MALAIIQARLGSLRLPGKVLMDFGNTTILGYLIDRVKQTPLIDEVVIATTINKEDDKIVDFASKYKTRVFRGAVSDVLERFYHAAIFFNEEIIVRLTADDPLKDPEIIHQALKKFYEGHFDYCSNTLTPSYPEGLDVEVFTRSALEKAFYGAREASEREHVTPYIWHNRENQFYIGQIVADLNRAHWRLTIDYEEDYQMMFDLEKLIKPDITYNELIETIERHNLTRIMQPNRPRNESYKQAESNENR